MNIAQIKQTGGVDSWIDFSGQIIVIKETKSRTKRNRLMTKVRIKDESDEIGVWLYTDKSQCTLNQVITANGMLKEYEGQRYIDYATVKNGQDVSRDNPQSSQQAAQATSPPRTDKAAPAWQPLDREHVQGNVICALLAARNRPKPEDVKKWTDYIMSGIHPDGQPQAQNNPQHVGDDSPKATDGDIPF